MSHPTQGTGGYDDAGVFVGGGRLGEVMAGWDWSATPVGPPRGWSPSLRQVVQILLSSRFSMWMGWGPELAFFYNDAYQRDTLRAKHPWALGRPAREVWAEIWDDIGPRISSVLQTGQATWDEGLLLFLERAGYVEETYHTFSYSPLRDENAQIAGFLCVVSEDTERVLGERRLRVLGELGDISAITAPTVEQACAAALEVLARYRLDLPFASVYLLDEDGTTVRRAGFYGVLDDPAIVPLTLDRDTSPIAPLWSMLASGQPQILTDLGREYGGLFVPMPAPMPAIEPDAAVAVPLTGSGGGTVGVLFAGISPFRALDEDYQRFVELVAGQVGASITYAHAYQAQHRRAEELAELDRAKTEFFAGVSHELRTPLTLIAGPAEDGLADTTSPLPAAQRTRMEVIARNSGRLRRLVDTMLDFARLEAGRAVPNRVATDLAALTRGIAESFAPAIERAGLGYRIECADLGSVAVDVDMWEKIVLNLLSNAVKYTLAGEITLTLRESDDGGVALAVIDTGIGIPAEELPRLFERFHRVRGATGRSHEGSGIGLALVAELAALHNGTARVESTLGAGSRFTVVLPPTARTDIAPVAASVSTGVQLYREEALLWSRPRDTAALADGHDIDRRELRTPDDQPSLDDVGDTATSAETSDVVEAGLAGGARVLVVEDNRDLRGFLRRLLAPHYTVLTAGDGITAWDIARTERPDLILTDVMMPRMDGFALINALRADPATTTTPIIMLSARAGEEAAAEGLAAGADDYLVKPFSSHDLLARVRSNLAMARLRNYEGAWRMALVNALQDGLYVVDSTGAVIEINQAFADILGYGPEQLPYPSPHPWWPDPDDDPDQHGRVVQAMHTIQRTGSGQFVLSLRHRDGHHLWASCSGATIPDPAAEGQMIVGVVRDVTAEHRARLRDRLLAESGNALTGPGNLTERLAGFVRLAAPVVADLVVISLSQPDGTLRPVAAAHRSRPETAQQILRFPPRPIPASLVEAYRDGRAFHLETVPGHLVEELAYDETARAGRRVVTVHASVVVPLTTAGRALGSLNFLYLDHPHNHDQVEVDTAQELGRRVVGAIEADRVAAREHHLHTVTAALAAAATVAEVATVLAASMDTVLGAGGVAVYTRDPDDPAHLHLAHALGYPPDVAATFATIAVSADLPVALTARTGEPTWLGDPHTWLGRYPHMAMPSARDAVKAVATVPMTIGARVIGVLALSFPTPRLFPPDERSFAITLAGQAALALDRAAISDARWEIARTLQLGLLPAELPRLAQVTMAARYLPAGHHTAAGGDWYDITMLDAEHVAIVVGDVVGHGSAAAAVMGQLRAALAAYLLIDPSPATALARLSRFTHQVPGARASTAICVVLDTTSGQLRWARAGHLPPLVVDLDGRTRYLDDAHGALLGLTPMPPITEGAAVLAPGSAIVLYTDGLVERRGEDIDTGLARLSAVVADHARDPVTDLLPHILNNELDGTGPHDDVAAVIARLRPAPLSATRPAHPNQLALIRRDVEDWADWALLPQTQHEDLQLALGEALANSAEHGHAHHPDRIDPASATTTPPVMRYRIAMRADGGVEVTTSDNGTWRPPPADPGYRGHGLRTIRALSEGLVLDHDDSGTTLRFTIPAPHHETPEPLTAADTSRPRLGGGPVSTGPQLQILQLPDRLVLQVSGELDLTTAAELRPPLLSALAAAIGPVEIDTRAVTYLFSAGVGLLLDAIHTTSEPVHLRVASDGATPKILRLAGLTSLTRPGPS